ncbi:MAG: tRNA (N(6)-L-threonylcarbamoyladenosine(37)-C(2))-methylthiotransferase MtaB [Lachnospiraceae bacterium]|nr:tRNA (N(6)-L-threonylcarbamoyladenosine(37)-C(2))-methylthiotransferase MtaB [Lachnospiraceae bacterium]
MDKIVKKAAFLSLGCKVNAYETEVIQKSFEDKGFVTVPFDEKADVYVVNTCTVTNIADRKSRQMLHKAKKENEEAVVVAVGCYVQAPQCTLETDDSVDILVGNSEKSRVYEKYEEYVKAREEGREYLKKHPEDTLAEYEQLFVTTAGERTRANIKIQDGCNQFCTYCIIPYVRGRIRSRKLDNILSEAKTLAANGYKEIVLTGIHVSSYGKDFDCSVGLIDVLEALENVDGIERIRLSSLEPRVVTDEFAKRVAALKKVCPHFHLSLQSGSAGVLKRMNRHYSPDEYYEAVERLRSVYDRPAITTDIIVGFPGETEEEFLETCEFAKKCGFSKIHIFPYSVRTGTKAAAMDGQLPEKVKKERAGRLAGIEKTLGEKYRESFAGQSDEVLFEEEVSLDGETYMTGHTTRYIKVAVKTDIDISGKIYKISSLKPAKGDIMVGECDS